MNNLTRCSLLLNLVLFPLLGFVILREPAGQPSVSDADVRAYISSAKSASLSELKSNDVSRVPAPAAVAPAASPAYDNTVWQPPRPDAGVLTVPGAEGEVVVPAVFAIRSTDTNLNSDQMEKVNEIIQSFTHEVSAGSTNPNDPAYLARWQKAQADADDRLRMVLGQEDYFRYTLAAGTMDTSK